MVRLYPPIPLRRHAYTYESYQNFVLTRGAVVIIVDTELQ